MAIAQVIGGSQQCQRRGGSDRDDGFRLGHHAHPLSRCRHQQVSISQHGSSGQLQRTGHTLHRLEIMARSPPLFGRQQQRKLGRFGVTFGGMFRAIARREPLGEDKHGRSEFLVILGSCPEGFTKDVPCPQGLKGTMEVDYTRIRSPLQRQGLPNPSDKPIREPQGVECQTRQPR